jgi:multicomponent Na+:H+ antiporter subunit B
MRKLALFFVIACGAVLVYVAGFFPDWGDPQSPASTHLSPHFIEQTMEETSVPMACFLLLRTWGRPEDKPILFRHRDTGVVLRFRGGNCLPDDTQCFRRIDTLWTPPDLIVTTVCRLLIPFVQLYALYVVAHGHHSPGGGFQGGVILGATFILLAISYDLRTVCSRASETMLGVMVAAGVFFYAAIGALCMAYGGNFLDYSVLAPLLHVSPVQARSLGILFVEIGVAVTVMATMVLIYNYISSQGRCDEGL